MAEIVTNGIIQSSMLTNAGIVQATSTRRLGNMSFDRSQHGRAPENFKKLMEQLDINLETATVCILAAKHTAVIATVVKDADSGRIILSPDRENREIINWAIGDLSFQKFLPDYDRGIDAAVSNSKRVYLAMPHADCAPIMLFDPNTRFFSLVHAGIIGTVTEILPATINHLKFHSRINPKSLLAYIGPCICHNCYDPTKSRHWPHLQPRLGLLASCFNLKNFLFNQLIGCGLEKDNIEVSAYCTSCAPDLFFSNHKAPDVKTEGRNLTIIGL